MEPMSSIEEASVTEPRGSNLEAIPATGNTVWADVSPLLHSACSELRDGELIHGENFNLFAAMSALEIMDPKMDAGIVSRYCSVDEAIEDGAAPVPLSFDKTVDVQCTIDIMDHLLACEATWHSGHSLAQSVFSCIYLLRPERTSSHALLHSYCKVIRATCKAVVSSVSDTRTHEEEDLFTMAYGLPLTGDGDGDEKCLSLLNAVEEDISRQMRACKALLSRRKALDDVEPLQTNPDLEEGYCKALLCRLRFRKHFFHLLACMRRPQGRGFELARKHITSCLSELKCIHMSEAFLVSNSFGNCVNEVDDKTTASGRQPVGFDANINCGISAPTPPRSIKLLSWKKAIEYFEKLLGDLDHICSYSLHPSFEVLLRFVAQFQKSQPDLVSRAYLQHLLVQDGKLYGRDPLFAVIIRAAGLPEVAKNHDIQKNEYIIQLEQLVINMLKILCTNVAWQRRKLGKVLQDWRVIYMQLELAFRNEFGERISDDENLAVKIFNHILIWVEEQTYWMAYRFLLLGFELDLYSPTEYCMVYWYMYIVLIKLAEKTHIRIAMSDDTAKRKGKKRKDTSKEQARQNRFAPAVSFLQCQICIAEGLTLLLATLKNELKVLHSPGPFNTENERFLQHFEILQKACIPDHASYPSFRDSIYHARFSTILAHNHFKDAMKLIKEVKSSFANDLDRLAELRRLEQVAEHNNIVLNIVCRAGSTDPSLNVSFEFLQHPFFATAVVKRK